MSRLDTYYNETLSNLMKYGISYKTEFIGDILFLVDMDCIYRWQKALGKGHE